jgi:hypothetical protein
MPITRANADIALLDRQGKLLVRVGKYDLAVNGPFGAPTTNPVPCLTQPLTNALFQLAVTPAAFGAVTDGDLAPIRDNQVIQFLDYATLELLLAVRGWCDEVDETKGLDSEKLSQTATLTDKMIQWWQDYIVKRYGLRPMRYQSGPAVMPATPAPIGITYPSGYAFPPGWIPGPPPNSGGYFLP